MEVRLLERDEWDGAYYLWSHAFHGGAKRQEEDKWLSKLEEGNYFIGAFDSQGLQAVVFMNDFAIYSGPDTVLKMGGIGGVATLPAVRGKGYAGKCLELTLAQMRETGHVVSLLGPFSWDFYRKYGWDQVGIDRRYSVKTEVLKADPETENVRAVLSDTDRDTIKALYTAFAQRYMGCLLRRPDKWDNLLDGNKEKHTYTYLYEKDGTPEGYLLHCGHKEEETHLREFVCLTARAQKALLGFLRRHAMQTEKFVWDAPEDDPLWNHYFHWDIETKLGPVMAGRVVDVAGAFQAKKPDAEAQGEFVFSVTDEHAPWNAGNWQVAFANGTTTIEKTTRSPQLGFSIQALSQAYFGRPTLTALRSSDRISVPDESAFRTAESFFAGPPVWLNDHF